MDAWMDAMVGLTLLRLASLSLLTRNPRFASLKHFASHNMHEQSGIVQKPNQSAKSTKKPTLILREEMYA